MVNNKKKYMKQLLVITLFLFLIGCGFKMNGERKYYYSGTVTSIGYEPPTSGYKSCRNSSYFIMMREDVTGEIIRVNLLVPDYNKAYVGKRLGFVMTNWDMERYGNVPSYSDDENFYKIHNVKEEILNKLKRN